MPQRLDPVRVRLAELVPDTENDREHPPEHLAQLRALIKAYGNVGVILVQAGSRRVIDGHGRLQILLEDGAEDALVYELDVDDERARMLAIAINRSPELAAWRPEVLTRHLKELDASGWDVERLTGWSPDDLDHMLAHLAGDAPLEDDAAPASDDAPAVTQRGDVWTFPTGHRLLCGESTNPDDMQHLMGGRKASLVNTDPPYGVAYTPKTDEGEDRFEPILNDALTGPALAAFQLAWMMNALDVVDPDAAWYIWHATSTRDEFAWAMKRAGLQERQPIIWIKPNATLGHSDYQYQHEPCFYAARDGAKPAWYGGRAQSTTWRIERKHAHGASATIGTGLLVQDEHGRHVYLTPRAPKSKKPRTIILEHDEVLHVAGDEPTSDTWTIGRDERAHHPTQKPLELAARPIRNHTLPGQIVLDPFLGSGSTLIAAETLSRTCYGIELDPRNCDRILAWYVRRTGRHPVNQHGQEYPTE